MTERIDERIGQNLVEFRGQMSQKTLADEMRSRGHKWSQTTVWSVEKGERPLRYSEANDIAAIFGVSLSALGASSRTARIEAAVAEAWKAREPLITAAKKLAEKQYALAAAADLAMLNAEESRNFSYQLTVSVGQLAADAASTELVSLASGFVDDAVDWVLEGQPDRDREDVEREVKDELFSSSNPHRAMLWERMRNDVKYSKET